MSYILHLPDKNKILYKNLLQENYTLRFNKPDNIDIVISITPNQIEDSFLIKQLTLNNYNFYNSIENNVQWLKYDKPIYIYQSLLMCNNEYSLILDGNDTVILKDLDDIIEDLLKYDLDIIFNAEIYTYKKLKKGCLNGGVCFGKTDKLLEFYRDVIYFLNEDLLNRKNIYPSEQKYLLKALSKHKDRVTIDNKRRFFICYNYEFKGE